MKMSKWTTGLTMLVLALLASGVVFAQEVKPNQTVCPVMGNKISKEVYTDYNGSRVYFCCEGCIAPFKKDPQKYLDQMKAAGVVLEPAPITQTTCPVTGKPIDPKVYSDHDGQRVYFCCQACKVKFDKDPAKYTKK